MKKKHLFTATVLFIIATCFFLNEKRSENRFMDGVELKETHEKEDGMREAILQEIEKTKDPSLGYVPYERLLLAHNHMKQMALSKTSAAIGGINWTERGPSNIGGRTRAILVDKNDATNKTVWAAGVGGGLWKTNDITATPVVWINIDDFFGNIAITSIAQDPTNPDIMYFGTGEGFFNTDAIRGLGIWKSTDGGVTWAQLASTSTSALTTHFHYIQKIVVNSTGKIFAATRAYYSNYGGLMMSSDGGTTWSRYDGNGGSPDNASDVELAANGDVYVSFSLGGSDGIYKSTNSGTSWTLVYSNANAQRIEVACAPNNSSSVYALLEDGATSGVLSIVKTTDSGTTWTTCAYPDDADNGISAIDMSRGQGWYDLAIAVDPNDANTLIVGAVNLFRSTDGGSNWSQISKWSNNANMNTLACSSVHADQHAIEFIPGSSSSVLFGNDGGVFYTTNVSDAATSNVIINKNNGYNVTQFYACAAHPSAGSNYFLAGAQDNGTQKFNSAGIASTTQASGGDGAFCHIDQDNSTYQFTGYVYQVIYRSANGGTSFSTINNNQSRGSFINPSDYDNTANILYAADEAGSYFRMVNATGTQTVSYPAIAEFSTGTVTHVFVSPNTANRVFFGLNNSRIVRVDNADSAPTATNITGALFPAGASVSGIAVGDSDDTLLVTFSNYGVTSVWYTTNATDAVPVWTSVEGDLPDMPVRWALFYPGNCKKAFLATELGVWSTDLINGASTSWAPTNTGLANVRTDMLQYRTSDRTIVAATHGRGLYTATLPSEPLFVSWTDFKGFANGESNQLDWWVAVEVNNKKFEIQRSDNGLIFDKIGEIKGAGNSTTKTKYSYVDYIPKSQGYYYRIKQIDFDGKYSYSKIIYVGRNESSTEKLDAVLFPNPVKDWLQINLNKTVRNEINISVFNLSGYLLVSERFEGSDAIKLESSDLSSLKRGTYFVLIETAKEKLVKKLVKL